MGFQGAIRERLQQGEWIFGTFTFANSPDVAEAVARAGMDIVVIDMEHAARDWSEIANLIRAIEVGGASPFVRVPAGSPSHILHALELGAEGLVLPMVSSPDDVSEAVDAARYAPLGRRGTCTLTRAATYGLRRDDFAAVAGEANEKVTLLGIIEDVRGVENIESILSVDPGLDAVIVGRSDLAADMGVPGETTHPDVLKKVDELFDRAKSVEGSSVSMVVYTPEECAEWASQGVSLYFYSADLAILAREFAGARSQFDQTRNEWKEN